MKIRQPRTINAARLVIKWMKETYRFPKQIKLTLEMNAYGYDKYDNMIVVNEYWGSDYDQGGYRTDVRNAFNILAWDGELSFLGIHHGYNRRKPLHVGDPKFFEKLQKSIITPTLKQYLQFPSNVFYTKPRKKL